MEQFEAFAKKWGYTTSAVPIPHRDEWDSPAIHWVVTLTCDAGETVWVGKYSKGIGHAESWVRDPKNKRAAKLSAIVGRGSLWECYNPPLPYGKRYRDDSAPVKALIKLYGKKHTPSPAEILLSLQLDARDCDVPFEHWANWLGYDSDSIKTKKVWEECNDSRRQLNAMMTREQLTEFWELEE